MTAGYAGRCDNSIKMTDTGDTAEAVLLPKEKS